MMLAANVGAVLISFIALVALVNLALGWLGGLAGRPDLSLQWLLSLVFAPCAWLLGVPSQDCQAIGGLLGTRTVLNEMIAYFDLGRMKETLTPKAFSLATIAMCSFANISSIGIQLGGIGALIPERRRDLAELGLKMLVISTLANALSAAIAGVIMP
jgi:CNT family concentrative nucleoside transporter